MLEADVLVVGGGLSGLAAAIASAASGANTLLLERSDELGGNVSRAYVHTFCGLFETPRNSDDFVYANPGFAPWFSEGLRKAGGACAPEIHGRVAVMPIYPPRLAVYAREVAKSFPSLSVQFGARLTQLEVDATGVDQAIAVYNQHGSEKFIRATIVIDTTGDATVGMLAGAEYDAPSSGLLQNATLIFRVVGANRADLSGYSRLRISAAIARGAQQGELQQQCESIFIRPGEAEDEAYISLNVPKWKDRVFDPMDDDFLAEYTQHAHDLAGSLTEFLRKHVPGWSKCKLLSWPSAIGVRESRHMLGRYVMTEEDVLSGAKSKDAIAQSTWPIELWQDHYHATFQYPVAACDIPLPALVSRTHSNIGMAGRCMSGSHEALGALRVLGTAMATGEAIGIAAAIAVDRGISLADVTAETVRARRKDLITTEFIQP